MSYNGYTNYETWTARNWTDADYESCKKWERLAASCLEERGTIEDATGALASMMKDDAEEGAPVLSGLYGDLLVNALAAIDWHCVARSYYDN